ncbi:MAG: low molecular weight phosphatase family protein [Rhodospirillaceae bacterium]
MSRVPSAVLFACNANAVRSPMAAALFRSVYGKRAYVDSVGVTSGEPDPFVAAVLAERGIDGVETHQPKTFDDLLDTNFEVIVALTREAYERALEITRTLSCDVLYWPTDDPAQTEGNREARLDAYRRVRDDLAVRLCREWPLPGVCAPEPGMPEDAAAPLAHKRSGRGLAARKRGRDLWSRMRMGLRRLRR